MSDGRLVRWLLRLYPAPWRRRHESEFADILASRPLTPHIVVDTIMGAIDARWNGGRSVVDTRRSALLLWWVVLHLFLGALAFLGITASYGSARDLFATITTFLILGSVGQWFILRRFFGVAGRWVSATMAGAFGGLALVTCIQRFVYRRGNATADMLLIGSVILCISVGQWLVLRRSRSGAVWWPIASAIGGLAIIPAHAMALTMIRVLYLYVLTDLPANVHLLLQLRAPLRAPGFLLLQGLFIVAAYALVTGAVLMWLYRPSSSEWATPGTIAS